MDIDEFFKENRKTALIYTGSCRSLYLIDCAKKANADLKAYYGLSQLRPHKELENAKTAAKKCGVNIEIIDIDMMPMIQKANSRAEVCKLCSKKIVEEIALRAGKSGLRTIINDECANTGNNGDQCVTMRTESGVLSPLRDAGIRDVDIPVYYKNITETEYQCLASAVPLEEKITEDALRKADDTLKVLRSLGYSNFKILVSGNLLMLKFSGDQMYAAVKQKETICHMLEKAGCRVLMDLV